MRGRLEQALGRAHLHDFPQIHHRDPAADVPDQAQVVRDEEIRQLQSLLQVHEQVDDLCLHGDVERRDGFVRDDERRVQRERPREADPLTLPAAELVRVPRELRGVEADEVEELGHSGAALGLRADAMDDERLFDDRARPACAD